ncbi:MAG: hypothetical protein LBJ88_04320 [Campylobacteraceae bacterium]|jgi:transcriptional regulator NrdR family protein|nr:hypothetical protein [Campylobacteraceae bacterium]
MFCPRCAGKTITAGVTHTTNRSIINRLRKCAECEYVFLTVEVAKHSDFWKGYVKALYETEVERGFSNVRKPLKP